MIRFFARHPTAATLLMVMLLALGALSIASLRRETLPDFSAGLVEITVVYPGATAEDVEDAICSRIDDAVDGVNYVEEVTTEATEGRGRVVVEMEEGEDIRTFLADIKTEVDAIDDFPERAEDPVVRELNRTDQVISLAVSGPMALVDLKDYCEDLKARLKRDAGISLVQVNGFSDRQIRIEIPAPIAMQYGLSMAEIAGIIRKQSVDLPAGAIENRDQDIIVRFTDERKTPVAFQDLVVAASDSGAEVRLGEIARIRDLFELKHETYIFNGKRAGLLSVTKTKTEDTLHIYDAVKAFAEKERKQTPEGVELTLTQDISSIVADRLRMLTKNGIQGLILVFFTLWLFFNFRLSFWVVMGLPVSFFGAFFIMLQINFSLNMLTMVGLLIGLGLLMDDAIVIAENIATHLSKEKSTLDAVVDGVSEVKNGVIASFTTTVCVFGPLCFLTGNMGKILRVMPVVLILVLAVSLIEAFWILPSHLNHALAGNRDAGNGRFRTWFNHRLDILRENVLGGLVDLAIRWRYLFVGLTLAAFIVSVGMIAGGILKFKAFPEVDGDVIQARILLPQGTPFKQTQAVVARLTQALDRVNQTFAPDQPPGMALVQNVSVQYNVNIDANESGAHVATVSVDLLAAETRNGKIDDLLNLWREYTGPVPDLISLKFTEPAIGPAGRAIEVRLMGEDLVVLKKASLDLQGWFGRFKGVFDLSDDLRPGKPEIRVRMKTGAKGLGLDAQTLATQLRSAYYGTTASEIQVGRESYEIDIRLGDEDKNSLDDLSYFHVTLPGGKQAPLGSVADLAQGRGYAHIASVNGVRTVTVQGEIDPRTANVKQVMTLMTREFLPTLKQKYPGLRVQLKGESDESAKTGVSLGRGFMIGLLGIFVLLSFQFKSYLEPMVVMIAIPFALIGVIWGHLLMGLELSMPGVMGAASLAGIVVNDSILLVEFIKIRRRAGLDVPHAARQASRERFRAVLLTSMTTIAGLMPLLTERSLQAQILIPLAVSIVFGLLASTLLVLVIVPCLYTILADFNLVSSLEED